MIKVENVSKTIKGQRILNHINLELEYGMVYGFVGRNGSGKTMLLKAICGFITPDEGRIIIDGKELGKELDFPPNIGVIIEKPAFVPYLSGVKNYSVGMKQRLALAQAFMEKPDILVLDECMNGLDKEGVAMVKKRILLAKKERKMVLLCSHIANDLQELCDLIFEIDGGSIVSEK